MELKLIAQDLAQTCKTTCDALVLLVPETFKPENSKGKASRLRFGGRTQIDLAEATGLEVTAEICRRRGIDSTAFLFGVCRFWSVCTPFRWNG